jgi:hypothetical protein
MRNFGTYFDPSRKQSWTDMASSKGVGLIARSIKVDYKFVSFADHDVLLRANIRLAHC